jgi:hypothetical protein
MQVLAEAVAAGGEDAAACVHAWTRRPVVPELTRSERRSWRLHCRLSIRLTPASLHEWRPVIERNLERLRSGVTGQPHSRNLVHALTVGQ